MSSRPSPSLSGSGAVLLALGLGLAGGLFDVLTGPGLRGAYAVGLVAGCLLAALTVRREALPVVVVAPPLLHAVIALVAGWVSGPPAGGSVLVRHGLDLFTSLVLEAPALLVATVATLVVAVSRGMLRGRTPAPAAARSSG